MPKTNKPSNPAGKSGQSSNPSGITDTRSWSDYRFMKEYWGSQTNFLMSYGLKPVPGDFEEGKEILRAMRENDRMIIEGQEGK